MEYCRHAFIKEVLGFDVEDEARNGILMVLSNYNIQFLLNNKVMTKGVFTGTFVPAAGGRPYLPERMLQHLKNKPVYDGLLSPQTDREFLLPDLVY